MRSKAESIISMLLGITLGARAAEEDYIARPAEGPVEYPPEGMRHISVGWSEEPSTDQDRRFWPSSVEEIKPRRWEDDPSWQAALPIQPGFRGHAQVERLLPPFLAERPGSRQSRRRKLQRRLGTGRRKRRRGT